MSILEIHNVSKKFQISHQLIPYLSLRERLLDKLRFRKISSSEDFWALQDISFKVEPGDSLGIIGKNGAGKSTLLKILSKITPPTSGSIVSRGRIASLLEVGTGFHPELTGRENVFLNGSILGMRRREIQKKFDEIVEFAGVSKFLDTPLKHYSSGMQLRLAFAVAAFLEPEILIIDEVLAVGDAEFQRKCLGKMNEVARSGKTILFVSHNLGAVRNLCNKGLVLSDGKVILDAPIAECIEHYLHSFEKQDGDSHSTVFKFGKPPGNRSMWIDKVEIQNAHGTNIISMGDALHFSVSMTSRQAIREPKIGFIIKNLDGVHLLSANNRYQTAEIHATDFVGTSVIDCDLGALPLDGGKYFVNLYLGDDLQDQHVIENAFSFEIRENDIWGKGQFPPKGISALWWPTRFLMTQQHVNPVH